jgi:hypothetical protein
MRIFMKFVSKTLTRLQIQEIKKITFFFQFGAMHFATHALFQFGLNKRVKTFLKMASDKFSQKSKLGSESLALSQDQREFSVR